MCEPLWTLLASFTSSHPYGLTPPFLTFTDPAVARRLPTEDPQVVQYLRMGYIGSQVLSLLIYYFITTKVRLRRLGIGGDQAWSRAGGREQSWWDTLFAETPVESSLILVVVPRNSRETRWPATTALSAHEAPTFGSFFLILYADSQIRAKNDLTVVKYVQPKSPMVSDVQDWPGSLLV